jgi:hypothetical protein
LNELEVGGGSDMLGFGVRGEASMCFVQFCFCTEYWGRREGCRRVFRDEVVLECS